MIDDEGNEYEGDLHQIKAAKKGKRSPQIPVSDTTKPKPMSVVQKLYHDKFFEQKRQLLDVTNKLDSIGYHFNKDSVYRALERSRFLKRDGNLGRYKFIQKYPPR